MKFKTIILLSLILSLSFMVTVNASGGSKTTTFSVQDYFGPEVCDLKVHFSWDSDSWQIGDQHTVSFSFEVENINPEITDLSISLDKITVRLKSDAYGGAENIVSEDVSNQITSLVWRQDSATFTLTPRSFSYDVKTPEPYQRLTEDSSTKLYYWVELFLDYAHDDIHYGDDVTLKAGEHSTDFDVSNEGTMHGGIEDPVWVTLKAQPTEFPTVYIVLVACIAVIIGASIVIVKRRKKRSVDETN